MSGADFNIHFRWLSTRSAWQDIEYHRQLRAQNVQQDLDNMDAANAAFLNAQQNRMSTSATNSAQATLTRLQAQGKAKADAATAQIDAAQSLLAKAQSATSSTTSTASSSSRTSSVVNTVA